MAVFGFAAVTTNVTIANAAWELRASTLNKPKVLQIEVNQIGTTAGQYGIGRPAASGLTPTQPQVAIEEPDGNGAPGLTTTAIAWQTGPTVPANFNRRYTLIAALGFGFVAVFPGGFGLPAGGSVVLWNIAATSTCNVAAVVSE